MEIRDLFLTQAPSPHLKSGASFIFKLTREFLGTLFLFFAACFAGGMDYVLSAAVFLGVLMLGDISFRFLGFSPNLRWETDLFRQGLLALLFFPHRLPLEAGALTALVLVGFYRFSGGRAGYVLSPACLALAFCAGLGFTPAFQLISLPVIPSAVLFAVWLALQFPRTRLELEWLAAVLGAGVLVGALHEMVWTSALLWCAAAGSLLFDRTLAPLTARGRLWFYSAVFILFAIGAAAGLRSEALITAGLVSGFFAAWIEMRTMTRGNHAVSKKI